MMFHLTPIEPYVSRVYTERLAEIRSEIAQLRSELRDGVNANNLVSSYTSVFDWICGTNLSGDVHDAFLGRRYEEKKARLDQLEREERYYAPLAAREASAIAQAESETRRRQEEEKRKEERRKNDVARRKEAEARRKEDDANCKEAEYTDRVPKSNTVDGCQQKKPRQKLKVKKPKAKSKGRLPREGDMVFGIVCCIVPYGAFVDIGNCKGLVHISELSDGWVANPGSVVSIGQRVRVKVIGVQNANGELRIALSLKRAGRMQEGALPGKNRRKPVSGRNVRLQMLKGKKVYVDGSSLALWSKELRFRVLPLLMAALQRAGFDANFVLDANIRRRLEALGDASGCDLLDQFLGECPNRVTIIPDGLGVGDYILPLADKNSGLILSNSTYTQYEKCYPWLKDKGVKSRLLKVEFVDGGLLVPTLGLRVSAAETNETSYVCKNSGNGKKRKHKGAKGQHGKGGKGEHSFRVADIHWQTWYDEWEEDDDDYYQRQREEEDRRREEEEEDRRREEEEEEW